MVKHILVWSWLIMEALVSLGACKWSVGYVSSPSSSASIVEQDPVLGQVPDFSYRWCRYGQLRKISRFSHLYSRQTSACICHTIWILDIL